MANRYAVASASGLLASTWDGGTLPGPTDDLFANGFTVSYPASTVLTALSIRTEAASGIAAGGTFSFGIDSILNADSRAGTTIPLNNINNLTVNGRCFGGTASNAYGILTGSGCVINGDTFGGFGGNAAGAYVRFGSIHFGKSTGGSGAGSACGTLCEHDGKHNGECKASTNNRGTLIRNGGYFGGTIDNTVNFSALYVEASLAIVNGVTGSTAAAPIVTGGTKAVVSLRNGLSASLVSGTFESSLARYPFVTPIGFSYGRIISGGV